MDAHRSRFVWGISLAALTSLIVGVAAWGIVFFLLMLCSNNFMPETLAAGLPVISGELLRLAVTWPGIGFLLALAGIIAGFTTIPDKGTDDRTRTCRWICRVGMSLSLAALFIDMLIIFYLRVIVPSLGLA